MMPINDAINPNHYKSASGLETIDVIRAFTDGLNGVEDLKKARTYLDYVIREYENS